MKYFEHAGDCETDVFLRHYHNQDPGAYLAVAVHFAADSYNDSGAVVSNIYIDFGWAENITTIGPAFRIWYNVPESRKGFVCEDDK